MGTYFYVLIYSALICMNMDAEGASDGTPLLVRYQGILSCALTPEISGMDHGSEY
jgi:hypothetical protein